MYIKEKLSLLWIFVIINYIFNDIFSLYFVPGVVDEAIGFTGGSWVVPLFFAVILETAFVMVLFSRILPYAVNRWANIVVGLLHTVLAVWSVTEGPSEPFYAFIVAAEIIATLLIVWYAWKWLKPETEKI
jgi:hypothetical protein